MTWQQRQSLNTACLERVKRRCQQGSNFKYTVRKQSCAGVRQGTLELAFEFSRGPCTMASHADGLGLQRPASIRSVASNASAASAVSLTRRARTRARSRTLTGGTSRPSNDHAPDLPSLDKPGPPGISLAIPA